MVYNTDEIIARANASKTNVEGTCQLWTRTVIGVDSAGDQDGDGDADAVDGWAKEPTYAKHYDRNAPAGHPLFFRGGSRGYGHRCISKGGERARSTDMNGSVYSPGHVGDTTIDAIERAMGVTYVGWSETMSGVEIPKPPPPLSNTPGPRVEDAIDKVKEADKQVEKAGAEEGSRREKKLDRADNLLDRAKAVLQSIKNVRKKR